MTKPNRNKFGKEPIDYALVKTDTHEKNLRSKTKGVKSNLKNKQGKLKKDNSKKKKMLKSSVDTFLVRKDSLTSNASETSSDLEKKQCDMCKLSYSSGKELIEHLLSLMHHTKMEDKETNPVHKCTLCVVTCKTMSDYRMHIGTDRHQSKLAILKGGEEVDERDNNKNKGLKHDLQAGPAFPHYSTYKNWHVHRGSTANNLSGPGRYNRMHQSTYYGYRSANPAFRQKHDYNFHFLEGDDKETERNSYNRDRISQQERRGVGIYQIDRRPWRKEDRPVFEPWGSGLYSGSNESHQRSNFHHVHKGHGDNGPSDYNVNSEDITTDDWDEHSFQQKEKFLAGIEDSYPVKNQGGHLKSDSNQSPGHFECGRSSRPEESVGRERKRPRHGDDIQELLPKSSKSAAISSDENIPVRDAPKKTLTFQRVDKNNLRDSSHLSTDNSNISRDSIKLLRDSGKLSRDPSNVSRDPSNVSRDPSHVSRDPSKVSRDSSNVSRDLSNVSRDLSNVSRDPSNVSRDSINALGHPSNVSRDTNSISRETSSVSRDTSGVSRDTSGISRDTSRISRDSNNLSREPSSLSRNPSNLSRDASSLPKEPSKLSNDNSNSQAISLTPATDSSDAMRMSSIDDASNNVLERAERLCKELREKREASQAEKDLLIQRQDREVLNKKMNDLNKKQQSYLKGHLKDSKESVLAKNSKESVLAKNSKESVLAKNSKESVLAKNSKESVLAKNSDSVLSSASTVHSKLKDQSSSLTYAVQRANKMTEELKNASGKNRQERSQTSPNLGYELSDKELGGFEHGKPADDIHTAPKPLPKPIVISKDSLQKMVNAPRSRAERLQLAKLLHSREEHKGTPTTTTRTSLQLGGLYDTGECYQESNLESNEDTTTIKLEDLTDAVRKQILDLIGGELVLGTQAELGPRTKSDVDKSSFVLSDENIDKSKKKKKSKVKNSKNDIAEVTDGVPKPKRKKSISKTLVPDNTTSSAGRPVNNQRGAERPEKEIMFKSTSNHIKVNATRAATHSTNSSRFELNRKSTMLKKYPDVDRDNENLSAVDSRQKVASSKRAIALDSDSDLEILASTDSDLEILVSTDRTAMKSSNGKLLGEKETISRRSPESIGKNAASVGTRSSMPTCVELNEVWSAGNDKRTSRESKSQLTSESMSQLTGKSLLTSESMSQLTGKSLLTGKSQLTSESMSQHTGKSLLTSEGMSQLTGKSLLTSESISQLTGKSLLTSESMSKLTGKSQLTNESMSQLTGKSQLTSENVMQKFPTIMNFHRPETDLEQASSPLTQATSSPLPCGPMLSPRHQTIISSLPLHQAPVPSNSQQPHPSVRLTLPPSAWLEERLSSNLSDTQTTILPMPESGSEQLDASPKPLIAYMPMFKSDSISAEVKDLGNCISEESSTCTDRLLNDIGNERLSGESQTGVGLTAFQGESTSQAVLELLSLSEREEEVKQEMMNMDLRLTRLHKLLEQAVVQINKCTERRTQLLGESQEISNKRMTLLRETAAVKQKDKTGRHWAGSTEVLSEMNRNQSACVPEESTGSKSSTATTTTLSCTQNIYGESNVIVGTTLSRADWLAKFSSFLPPDTAGKRNNVSGSEHLSEIPPVNLPDRDTMNVGLNHLRDVEMTNDDDNNSTPIDTNSPATASLTRAQNGMQGEENTANLPAPGGVTNSLFSGPILYLGSFRSPEAPMNLRAPVIRLNAPGAATPLFKSADNAQVLCHSYDSSGEGATQAANFEDMVSLPKPFKSNNTQLCGGEDSDTISGASCCSIVSGSSLGEKISFYCRNNASFESGRGYGKNSLSTIMSDTCDQSLTMLPRGNECLDEMNSWSKMIRPCSVPLDRIDTQSAKDNYGTLDKQAIKSAEALHLMERNFEDSVSVCPSAVSSDGGKKKKRRTRQERDISGLRRLRRQHIFFSSSSDEAQKSAEPDREVKVQTVASPTRNDERVSSCEKNCSDRSTPGKERSTTTLAPVSDLGVSTPTKSAVVTIAACDSSTSVGLVDSEGITERIKILKEMKRLDRAFGRPVRSPEVTVLCDSSDDEQDFRAKKTDESSQIMPDSGSVRTEDALIASRSYESGKHKEGKSSSYNFDGKAQETLADTHLDLDRKMSRFPGNYGPVIELQVLEGSLYVAYSSFGVQIFSLLDTSSEAMARYSSSCLHCMTVAKLKGCTTLVTGLGGKLSFCDTQKQPRELDQVSFDMGTPVKCLLMLEHIIYVGLATGEISVFDTKKMTETDRFICCDHPIHCLAPAQEGSSKLLCVSSQDGTILIVNAHTSLPLRILTGHTKTSFSLQVDGPFVYSGSGDSCVIIHNLHTGVVEHSIHDNQGLVKTVCYNNGFLFTGGMDRLVRCYDTKTRKLVQVYYGAERGVITKIFVYNNMLITGNITGAVDCVELDVKAKHRCHKGCKLKFGNRSHLFWHLLEDHNITTMT